MQGNPCSRVEHCTFKACLVNTEIFGKKRGQRSRCIGPGWVFPRIEFFRRAAALSSALILCGCAVPSDSLPRSASAPAVRGAQLPHTSDALGAALSSAAHAWRQVERQPGDPVALETYNAAVARVMGVLKREKLSPWESALLLPSGGEFRHLTYLTDPRKAKSPAEYDFIASDSVPVKTKRFGERSRKEGIGAPLVATARKSIRKRNEELAPPQDSYGVTAILRFRGDAAELELLDPLETETVRMGGREFPLAADFSAPLAYSLRGTRATLDQARLLRPDDYADTARIIRMQPYDPDKTVLLFIHGLKDTAATWMPMINRLRSDPAILRKYQIWLYSYPSGFPYGYSASVLRRQLDEALAEAPLRRPMVVIGHSMGGCIARLLVTDTGDKLWKGIFGRTPQETRLPERTKRLLSNSLVFKKRPEVGRVIFIAAPLRGSELARGLVGRIGSMLVRTPRALLRAGVDAAHLATLQFGELKLRRAQNAIDTLAPNSRYVRAINAIPIASGVPLHVIVGDRGLGGNKTQGPDPVMGDGVVPYWSSHLPQADSEKIVPSDHSAHQHPQSIAEVARILHAHANH
ncbi:MAG: alpha/beta hydrolase [Chthoniobacterales bacterium]|nr:alpha/beta hydrolase [Chthoniobacterales bacterium]